MAGYIALLRGINVGGKNLIRMADLKECFEASGFEDVSTYIQSGNVLFSAPRQSRAALVTTVEGILSDRFGYEARATVLAEADLRRIVKDAPQGFGEEPDKFLSDVLFLMPPLTPAKAMKEMTTREGVDSAAPGRGVIYWVRLAEGATRSHLSKVTQLEVYSELTIRSWSTTTKLLAKLDELRAP